MSSDKTPNGSNQTQGVVDIQMSLEDFLALSMLVPMTKDPKEPDCIWGMPSMLHGSPGIGKTARIYQASRAVGLTCMPVELGGRQPEDASGAPFLTRDDKLVIACLLPAVNELNAIGEGVLFLDELTNARPSTQGAFLTAVQERRVGDTRFSNKIRVICAGNPMQESAGGYILQPPMANRLAHRDVKPPTVEEYTRFLLHGENSDIQPIHNAEQRIIAGWSQHWPHIKGQIIGFLQKFPQHLFAMPKQGHPNRGKAFPTPRSVEMAGRALATARILNKDAADQMDIVSACIGSGAATSWATWIREADLPDPLHVLRHGWKVDTDRLDRTIAVYASMVAYVLARPQKEKLELAVPAYHQMAKLKEANLLDLMISPGQALAQGGCTSAASPEIAKAAREVMLFIGRNKGQDLIQ